MKRVASGEPTLFLVTQKRRRVNGCASFRPLAHTWLSGNDLQESHRSARLSLTSAIPACPWYPATESHKTLGLSVRQAHVG